MLLCFSLFLVVLFSDCLCLLLYCTVVCYFFYNFYSFFSVASVTFHALASHFHFLHYFLSACALSFFIKSWNTLTRWCEISPSSSSSSSSFGGFTHCISCCLQISYRQTEALDYLTEVIAELFDNPGIFDEVKKKLPNRLGDLYQDHYVLSTTIETIFDQVRSSVCPLAE